MPDADAPLDTWQGRCNRAADVTDPDLVAVVDAWPVLSAVVRGRILAMIQGGE